MKDHVLERMQKFVSLKGVYFYCTQFLHGEYTVILNTIRSELFSK